MIRNLLSRRVLMPLAAAVIGIGGALATNISKPLASNYWVASVDGSNYVLTSTAPANCGNGTAQVCQISTETTPVNNRVPINQSSVTKRRP